MSVTSVSELVALLRDGNILQPNQLQLLTPEVESEHPDVRSYCESLLRRKWLTQWQFEQLTKENGQNLVLGPYVLLDSLGEGGMGQVYKARHQMLQRIDALKVIREERLLKDPEAVLRFQREARAAALLRHPNVVMVYDAGRTGDTYYIAMEYVEGTDLSKLVKDGGPLPVHQACDFIRQATLGLQHAHEMGMVHRDIKPSNLLACGLTPQPGAPRRMGTIGAAPAVGAARAALVNRLRAGGDKNTTPAAPVVKILDMGLVRMTQQDDGPATGHSLTQDGSVIGTPDYIAPEQARNAHRVDIRADLYSMGCTLYYVLTGQPPFTEGSAFEKLLMHQLDEPEPVQKLRPDVPAEVAAIVQKLMHKQPRERFQTPGELAQALAAWTTRKAAPAPQARPRAKETQQRLPTATATAPPSSPTPARPAPSSPVGDQAVTGKFQFTPPPLGEQAVTGKFNVVPQLDFPGQSTLSHQGSGETSLSVTSGEAKTIAALKGHKGCVMCVAFAPNRDSLASGGVDNTVKIWDFVGGKKPGEKASLVKHLNAVHSLAFTPDSRILASGSGGMDGLVWVWSMTEATPREITVLQGHQGQVDALAFSNDSKMLASGGSDLTVRIWEVYGRQIRQKTVLKGHKKGIKALAFSPDGQVVASAGDDCTVRLWSLTRMWSKEMAILQHPAYVYSIAFTPDGSLLATGGQDQVVRLWDLTASPPTERAAFKAHRGAVRQVLIPADGKSLVTAGEGRQAILWDLESGALDREWPLPRLMGSCFSFTFDGRYLANGGSSGIINVYRVGEKRARQSAPTG